MKRRTVAIYTLAGLLALTGCAEYGPKESGGALLGAAAGGVAGAQFGSGSGRLAATALGTLLGAGLGASAGRSLDRADAVYAERYPPQQVPRPSSHYRPQASWRSPGYGYDTAYEPAPLAANGCRYVGPGAVGEPTYACRAPNGAWYLTR